MKKAINIIIFIILILISVFTTHHEGFIPPAGFILEENSLAVHFVDVGQADCQIIQLPDNSVMMIDAGNNDDASLIGNYLDSLGIEKIDYLVATHPHEDHIGALDYVIDNYEIGTVYMPNADSDTESYYDVIDAINYHNLPLILTQEGTTICESELFKAQAVAPVYYYEDLNNMSIVMHLTYKNSSFIFTGDCEAESENDITADISADVLSVGHHGSSTSTTDYFLERVDPMYAVISCGIDNDYGHPHWETTEKLEENDITTYRTDKMGTIICTTKGEKGDYKWETIK